MMSNQIVKHKSRLNGIEFRLDRENKIQIFKPHFSHFSGNLLIQQ